jgi:hypothetical protein
LGGSACAKHEEVLREAGKISLFQIGSQIYLSFWRSEAWEIPNFPCLTYCNHAKNKNLSTEIVCSRSAVFGCQSNPLPKKLCVNPVEIVEFFRLIG